MTNEARKGLRSFAELYERNKDGVEREMSKIKDETRGGPRKGAGRKPFADTLNAPRKVTLDDATVEKAREIGGGNLSKGIRIAVESYIKESV